MNRTDFQRLATARLADAKALFEAECWPGLYYVSGYAVECAMKACIAKQTRAEDFPDKETATKCHTHNLAILTFFADLEEDLETTKGSSRRFARHWEIVKDWNPRARYELTSESKARELYQAVIDPRDGVMPWILTHW